MSTMNEALDLYQALGRTDALGRLSWAMCPADLDCSSSGSRPGSPALGALGDIASADTMRGCSAQWHGRRPRE